MITRNKFISFVTIIFIVMLSACATERHRDIKRNHNYTLGKAKTTSVGNAIVMDEYIEWIKGRKWVGIAYSPDGYKHFSHATDDSYRKELLYTGRSGDTLHVTYREYKRDFARPAFFQNLTYDLSASNIIVFQNYKIQVLEATNSSMKSVVLKN